MDIAEAFTLGLGIGVRHRAVIGWVGAAILVCVAVPRRNAPNHYEVGAETAEASVSC
jgi:hypothetical protein